MRNSAAMREGAHPSCRPMCHSRCVRHGEERVGPTRELEVAHRNLPRCQRNGRV